LFQSDLAEHCPDRQTSLSSNARHFVTLMRVLFPAAKGTVSYSTQNLITQFKGESKFVKYLRHFSTGFEFHPSRSWLFVFRLMLGYRMMDIYLHVPIHLCIVR